MAKQRIYRAEPETPRDNRLDRQMPRKRRNNTCPDTGKIRYRDHHAATLALTGMRRVRSLAERDGVPTKRMENRSYKCHMCKGWHLTSQGQRFTVAPVVVTTVAGTVTLRIPLPTDLPRPAVAVAPAAPRVPVPTDLPRPAVARAS